MKVKWLGRDDPVTLRNGHIYEVLAEEHGSYRVIDEEGEDYLYPKREFEIVEKYLEKSQNALDD
ncbi:MAG: hypothetical protein LBN34_00885 [Clostridiales Family XIII bacterium]|jgi:hypothetical protein|nr:hypothetical protein [Clostridiales Family XIII bacterium]